MAKQLRPRRGTTDSNASLIGALGEVTVDTTKSTLRVHDGSTAGGTELARVKDIPTKISSFTNDSGYAKTTDLSGYATKSSLGSYLPLSGGTLSGTLTVNSSISATDLVKGTQLTANNGADTNLDFLDSHGTNGGGWYLSHSNHVDGNWTEIWTKDNLTKVSQLTNDSGYLTSHQSLANCFKTTGGTLSGSITLANNTANLSGDDCYFGDSNIGGAFCIQGNNANTKLAFRTYGSTWGNASNYVALEWNGSAIACSTNFTASTLKATSDKNLKTDFSEVKYDLSSLKAYRYKFKEGEDKEYHVGLIAQEVQKVIPEAVDDNGQGHLCLDYNSVVAALVAKVNDLQEQINQLKEAKNG